MLRVTVSGSFHRFMAEIERAVQEFTRRGVRVLSPAYPTVVDYLGEFLFVASDQVRSIRLVQDRHLASIAESDFLWLVAPDGYVGQSAAMEIGFAVARAIPVLSTVLPSDLTLKRYVTKVAGMEAALGTLERRRHTSDDVPQLLIDPSAAIDSAHIQLDTIQALFAATPSRISDRIGLQIYQQCELIRKNLQYPSRSVKVDDRS